MCNIGDAFSPGHVQLDWLHQNDKYTIGSGYNWRQREAEKCPLSRWIWSEGAILKHSFLCWIEMHGRLQMKDRLHKIGVNPDEECLLCGDACDTTKHLFFSVLFHNNALADY